MVTDRSVSYKFNWGDTVEITAEAPGKYQKAVKGSVCGIREIDTEMTAQDFEEPIGSILYLVESSCGNAIEVPEKFLKLL